MNFGELVLGDTVKKMCDILDERITSEEEIIIVERGVKRFGLIFLGLGFMFGILSASIIMEVFL
jgi:hypothetical protein